MTTLLLHSTHIHFIWRCSSYTYTSFHFPIWCNLVTCGSSEIFSKLMHPLTAETTSLNWGGGGRQGRAVKRWCYTKIPWWMVEVAKKLSLFSVAINANQQFGFTLKFNFLCSLGINLSKSIENEKFHRI